MKEKVIIYESEYLAYEFMPCTNIDFVLQEFKQLNGLEDSETEWDSYPEWLEYMSIRPLGNKPYPILDLNIGVSELCELLQRHHLSQIPKSEIEIEADERGIYASEIRNSEIYGNPDFHIIISAKDGMVEYMCLIPSDKHEENDMKEMKNLIGFFINHYHLILVDWRGRAFI